MNQHPFFWSSLSQVLVPLHYINVVPSTLLFSYESGLTDMFYVSSDTGYTISVSDSWISVDIVGINSGYTTGTTQTLVINSGVTDLVGTITIQNITLGITRTITVTQEFEPQPLLFIMTEGGLFEGMLV
jgi:hypothetical protein